MRYAFIKDHQVTWSIKNMAALLRVSVSGFYQWLTRKSSTRQIKRHQASLWIHAAHQSTRQSYGVARLQRHLKNQGIDLSLYLVRRIREEEGIYCLRHKRYKAGVNQSSSPRIYKNLLQQYFRATHPNQIWVSDITYIWTDEGWLYLAGVKDLYSKELLGYCLSNTMTSQLCLSALEMAIKRRNPPIGLIVHSDRGSQYRSKAYHQFILASGFMGSMSAKGCCYNNAPIESFWGILKNELIYHQYYQTRQSAIDDITQYMELFYNRIRIQASLGFRSPAQVWADYYQAA